MPKRKNKEHGLIDRLYHDPKLYLTPDHLTFGSGRVYQYLLNTEKEIWQYKRIELSLVRRLIKKDLLVSFEIDFGVDKEICYRLSLKAKILTERRHRKNLCEECRITKILRKVDNESMILDFINFASGKAKNVRLTRAELQTFLLECKAQFLV